MNRPILLRLIGPLSFALAGSACAQKSKDDEFVDLGRTQANSEPPPGVFMPMTPGDLQAVQDRGRLLHAMERTLRLAYEQGAYKVGVPEGDVIMPLVDVDPGERSSQVVFLRWPKSAVGEGGALDPLDAQRWLMVSMLLSPDRVLDVELLGGKVVEDSPELARAQVILSAAQALRARTPGQSYHLFTLHEVMETDKKRRPAKLVTRVYALSSEGDGPDLELLIDEPRRSRAPEVLKTVVVHEAPASSGDPWVVEQSQPAPATVARVLARGPQAAPVQVRCSSGLWTISPADGRVARSGSTDAD